VRNTNYKLINVSFFQDVSQFWWRTLHLHLCWAFWIGVHSHMVRPTYSDKLCSTFERNSSLFAKHQLSFAMFQNAF